MQTNPVIHSIYRAGAGLATWSESLDQLASRHDLWIARVFARDPRSQAILYHHEGGVRASALSPWVSEFHRIDPFAAVVEKAPVGQLITCREHFDDEYVARNDFYQRFLIPCGARYSYGAKVAEEDGAPVVVMMRHGDNRPPLTEEERVAIEDEIWHIEQAFKMRDELGVSNGLDLDLPLLERVRQPVVVLDANRRIVYRNSSGAEVIERGDPIEDRSGLVACIDQESDSQLATMLRGLTMGEALGKSRASWNRQSLWLKHADGENRVLATLTSLRSKPLARAFGQLPLALLTLFEPGLEKDIDCDALIEMFSLTRAEARVAARLVSGLSVQEIAREFGVGVTTVRSQLKALFEKTGTRRQAELVRLLLLATEI